MVVIDGKRMTWYAALSSHLVETTRQTLVACHITQPNSVWRQGQHQPIDQCLVTSTQEQIMRAWQPEALFWTLRSGQC